MTDQQPDVGAAPVPEAPQAADVAPGRREAVAARET